MTAEEQRIAIAKSCDFYVHESEDAPRIFQLRHGRDVLNNPWQASKEECWEDAPDYLHDLNAMHEAEKTLNERQWFAYCEYLRRARLLGEFGPIHATAAQRAEAFLKTLGLWKD